MARLVHAKRNNYMKIFLSALVLLIFTSVHSQVTDPNLVKDTAHLGKPDNTRIKDNSIFDTTVDYRPHNKYGGLLNDDPVYNPKYPWYKPAFKVFTSNLVSWASSKYLFKYDWADISLNSWKYNLKHGFVWDDDHFGTNFIGHPHSGNIYYNVARSNGYSYWSSIPFAVGGSLMWEFFGENTQPSKNDIINTPFSGLFLGEVLYRITSNILDDRARGANRVWRELLAGVINPPRALNRFSQKKMFRVTNKEVYQKEPLNITLRGGVHLVNTDNKFATGTTNYNLKIQFDYGDPFEVRHRKPFDVFRLGIESSLGKNRKLLENVMGYGILIGKNVIKGDNGLLIGGFQYFDYWNNNVFELGSLGLGGGIISKVPVSKNSALYSSLHLAVVPLAGNNTGYGPDTSVFRDYNFAGGLEAKIEETFHISTIATLGFSAYYYWLHNYENLPGRSSIGILKPRLTINITKSINIGMEHQVFYVNRFLQGNPTLELRKTEQKFFLQYFFEDHHRTGRYH
jgi:hypothetical protein